MRRKALWTAAMAAVLMLTTDPALAQFNRPDRNGYSENEVRQIGYRAGYQYGVQDGRADYRMRQRFDPKRSRAFKDGKWGYRNEYRHDWTYKNGFRDGYLDGYLVGYRAGYNNSGWDRRNDDRWGNGDWNNRDDYRNRRNNRNNRRNRPWWSL